MLGIYKYIKYLTKVPSLRKEKKKVSKGDLRNLSGLSTASFTDNNSGGVSLY